MFSEHVAQGHFDTSTCQDLTQSGGLSWYRVTSLKQILGLHVKARAVIMVGCEFKQYVILIRKKTKTAGLHLYGSAISVVKYNLTFLLSFLQIFFSPLGKYHKTETRPSEILNLSTETQTRFSVSITKKLAGDCYLIKHQVIISDLHC